MIKNTLLGIAAVFTFSFAQAQSTSFGVKAGLNFAQTGGKHSSNIFQNASYDFRVPAETKTGFHFGVLASFGLSEKISIQPEVVYATKGFDADKSKSFSGASASLKGSQVLNYIDIPVLVKVNVHNFYFEAGPQFSYLMKAETDFTIKTSSFFSSQEAKAGDYGKDGFKSTDIGFALGTGYKLDNGLFFGLRYSAGFSTIFDKDHKFTEAELEKYAYRSLEDKNARPELTNKNFQLTVGYMFTTK